MRVFGWKENTSCSLGLMHLKVLGRLRQTALSFRKAKFSSAAWTQHELFLRRPQKLTVSQYLESMIILWSLTQSFCFRAGRVACEAETMLQPQRTDIATL